MLPSAQGATFGIDAKVRVERKGGAALEPLPLKLFGCRGAVERGGIPIFSIMSAGAAKVEVVALGPVGCCGS